MADSDTPIATGHDPIGLQANSYDFQKMHAAAVHAEQLKTDDGRSAAFGRIAEQQAAFGEIATAGTAIAVPPDHTLARVNDAQGNPVIAAVYFADEKQRAAAQATLEQPLEVVEETPTDEGDEEPAARRRKAASPAKEA